MNVLFAVQGDGRGHMTQAIAYGEMLANHGHKIVGVLAGTNQSRQLPAFFLNAFGVPVRTFESPGFSMKQGRSISTVRSAIHLFRNLPTYSRSLDLVGNAIRETRPDLVINFLEPLVGYFYLRRRSPVPMLAVAHHFMFEHPRYPRIGGFPFQRIGMKRYVNLTAANAHRLGLSFYPADDLPQKRLFVCPPILRRQLFQLTPDPNGKHLLVYLLNHGYETEVQQWHASHPDVPVHCFYDKPGAPAEEQRRPNLTFHALHGEKYLRLMASSGGVVCTAGFESISEAAYLGKPLLMIPVENHPEQHVNSTDAELCGLGMRDNHYRLERLLQPAVRKQEFDFKSWVNSAEKLAVRAAEITAGWPRKDRTGQSAAEMASAER